MKRERRASGRLAWGRQALLRGRQLGQSSTEYIIITTFAILILIEGGNSAPVTAVATALKNVYRGFVYAISYSSTLMAP